MNPPAGSTSAQAPTEAETYAEFWQGLDEFLHALRRARGRAAASAPPGELTNSQFKLLESIIGSETPRIGEIAACLEIAPPTATRMIAGLERDGLIERRPAPEDRRVVRIELTAEGKAARRRAKRRLETKRRRLYETLDDNDREHAARLLKNLAEGLDAL